MSKLDKKSKKRILLILKALFRERKHSQILEGHLDEERQKNAALNSLIPARKDLSAEREMPTSLLCDECVTTASNEEQNEPADHTLLRQNLEKMTNILKEKDKRITELLHYEYSAKKAIEQKTWQQEALEKERLHVKYLEKEKEKQALALSESHQSNQKLQVCVEALKIQLQELVKEKNQLLKDSLTCEETIARLRTEKQNAHLHCQQLNQTLDLEINGKRELELELKSLYKQFQSLKDTIEMQKDLLKNQRAATTIAEEQLNETQHENENLKRTLKTCQEEVLIINQHVKKGMREAKDLENRYCEAVNEKLGTLKALHQLQREFDRQQQELADMKDKFKLNAERDKAELSSMTQELSSLKKHHSLLEGELLRLKIAKETLEETVDLLTMKNELLESECHHFQKIKEQLNQKTVNLEKQLQRQVETLTQSMHDQAAHQSRNETLQKELHAQQSCIEEKQLQLDEAHHHLAKRVREVALLSQRVEELTLQMTDIDNARLALQETSNQLQNDLLKNENEKKELHMRIQLLEDEAKKWEERWLLAEHRSQQAEEKILELEKIEQRHTQLKNFLSGLGPLPGVHFAENKYATEQKNEQPTPLQFGSPLPVDHKEKTEEMHPQAAAKAYPNLFDLPHSQKRPKQDLFD